MKFLKTDIKRALSEPAFLATLCATIIIIIGSYAYILGTGSDVTIGHQIFKRAQSYLLPFIAPILAAIPFCNMNMLEEDCGYQKLLLVYCRGKRYEWQRFLSNGIVGGLVLFIPVCLLYIISAIGGYTPELGELAIVLVYEFIFGFAYASISYGLTFICKKRYLPIIAPQVYYLLFLYAFPHLGLEMIYPPMAFSPWIMGSGYSIGYVWLVLSGLLGISILLLIYQIVCKKKHKN